MYFVPSFFRNVKKLSNWKLEAGVINNILMLKIDFFGETTFAGLMMSQVTNSCMHTTTGSRAILKIYKVFQKGKTQPFVVALVYIYYTTI